MPFCDLFYKNRIRMPKIRTLKNIWVSRLQKMAKVAFFTEKLLFFTFQKVAKGSKKRHLI